MNDLKDTIKNGIKNLFFWIALSVIIGGAAGFVGAAFHIATTEAAAVREGHKWLLYLLPFGGIFIIAMYKIAKKPLTTNTVIESVREKKAASSFLAPFIFISATISHLLGASVGREGAALQIGGGVGSQIGKILKLDSQRMSVAVVCGMAAAFSAIFTTPVTAVIFALEVVTVGHFKYFQLAPAMISSAIAYMITILMENEPLGFVISHMPDLSVITILKICVFAIALAALSILYCKSIRYAKKGLHKITSNSYLRIFIGGTVIVILTVLIGSQKYNGAGMDTIKSVLSGNGVAPWAFFVKMAFTAICVAAGYKGGEIVPAMFVGATFGAAVSSILGFDSAFCASIGLICIFCGITNCPLASFIMGIELFGSEGALFMGVAVAISYVFSGMGGLYTSQRLVYSKTDISKVDTFVK